MVSLTPRPLYPRDETRFPLNRSLDGPYCRSSRFQKERNFIPLPRIEPLDRRARSLVTVLTMLPQLYLNLKLHFEITYECKSVPVGLMKWVSRYWPLIFDWNFTDCFSTCLTICTLHPILFGWLYRQKIRSAGMYHVWRRGNVYTGFVEGKTWGKETTCNTRA